ncbi:CPBP family intramembrane glutamic endopeptidase [Halorarius litoreus]|uniref:CPBP family intramembrane glutamic endopeptidase n=1 Tax=Halorarius litoreus TaxID=2962676 RepID=UPI0020CB9D5D|nr:CPBP family intramembrane glutamic endopeptidase [Halorarius litoreus]
MTDVVRGTDSLVGRLTSVVWGTEDSRLRATWRVLLAAVVLRATEPLSGVVTSALGVPGMLPRGVAQAGVFTLLFVAWARYVDRRALADYGLEATPAWFGRVALVFAAVVAAHVVWFGVAAALGWATFTVAPAFGLGVVPDLAAVGLALAVNVWVQETTYQGLALRSAAEGAHARGLDAGRAVVAGLAVSVAFFVLIHGVAPVRMPTLAAAGALFGLLYVHTGELSYPVGLHLGANFAGGWLFAPAGIDRTALFVVSETLPFVGSLSAGRLPQLLVAYLLVVAWLRWRDGSVGVASSVARWQGR